MSSLDQPLTPDGTSKCGQRGRIVQPTPPAPVPAPRKAASPPAGSGASPTRGDRSRLTVDPADGAGGGQGSSSVVAGATVAGGVASGSAVAANAGTASAVTALAGADAPAGGTSKSGTLKPGSDVAGGTQQSDSDVVRSTGSMAIATLISRITGFLRNAAIGATMGPAVASAFNVANTLPNLITEIVLGAVLTSLVVPVLVRAEKEDEDNGAEFIRRLFTLSITLLTIVTVGSVAAAPLLTVLSLGSEGKVNISQSTAFAFLLLPQIFFYGIFSLFMAVLNTRGIFKPGAWAPVFNNLIMLATLALYRLLPGRLHPNDVGSLTDPHILLLGLGTTLGVVIQAMIMVPYLRKAGIDLRPLWGLDDRLKQFGGMALAIIVYVAISQAGFIITTRIASHADASAPNIYQQAWLLLQVPYGIIGVTLLTAIMPRLSRRAADGDDKGVVDDLTLGTKLTLIALIPIITFFSLFGTQIALSLFAYGDFDSRTATILGWTLSFSAFTLIPYALVLLHLRVFYAREEAWTPTFIIAGITGTKVLLSMLAPFVATSPSRVVVLLGAANGFGFVAGAVIGAFLLRRKLGSLRGSEILKTTFWMFLASAVAGGIAWLFDASLGHFLAPVFGPLGSLGSLGSLIRVGLTGILFLAVTGLLALRLPIQEIQSVAGMLGRIPGLSRIIKPRAAAPAPSALPEKVSTQDLGTQSMHVAPVEAGPVPPPMSAGLVRAPRLVPGASIANGRYRLLANHGFIPGAKFWHALDTTTGRQIALTLVDTSGDIDSPLTPTESAEVAEKVIAQTTALAALETSGIAPNIAAFRYRNGCIVTADWVAGSALKAVAENEDVNPKAAAFAVSSLANAAAAARAVDATLGLDALDRIRINSDGEAVLAFPAVLPLNSPQQDQRSLGAMLDLLIKTDDPALGENLQTLRDQALSEEKIPAAEFAKKLRKIALGDTEIDAETDVPDHIEVTEEATPHPQQRAGFGSKQYSRKSTAVLGVIAVALVALIAALTMFLMGLFGGNRDDSPVNVDSIESAAPKIAREIPVRLAVTSASEWGTGRNLPQLVDETNTIKYSGGAVELKFNRDVRVSSVRVHGINGNTSVKVWGLPDGVKPDLANAVELGTGMTAIETDRDTVVRSIVVEAVDGMFTADEIDVLGMIVDN